MPLGPDSACARVLFGGASVVFHVSEMAVARFGVAVHVQEVVFGEFEDYGD
jgi:hypothetical protein